MFDLDNEDLQPDDSVGGAKIKTAGIHHNIEVKGVTLEKGKYKKGPNKGDEWVATKFVFENEHGETHEEMFFRPPATVDQLGTSDWTPDKYQKIDGKSTKVGKVSKEEYVKIQNNDFAYFLLDLADALGFKFDQAKALIGAAKTFEDAAKLFREKFMAGIEKKRISMKLLWSNNDKDRSSYLKLHDFITYYPFNNDIFDVYVKDRRTVLFISEYEDKNKMNFKFENERKPRNEPTTTGTTPNTAYDVSTPSKQTSGSAEADPF